MGYKSDIKRTVCFRNSYAFQRRPVISHWLSIRNRKYYIVERILQATQCNILTHSHSLCMKDCRTFSQHMHETYNCV